MKKYPVFMQLWRFGGGGGICFQASSYDWHQSVPHGYKTKVPMFLLGVHQGPLAATKGFPHSLPCGPLHLQESTGLLNTSHALNV